MIEFTADQDKRDMHRDCRVWTELMVKAWYASEYPHAADYAADELVMDLREIYFASHNSGVQNIALISLLALLVLQAKGLKCSEQDAHAIIDYFLMYARVNNVSYAQNWIEFYLEEITTHGSKNSKVATAR